MSKIGENYKESWDVAYDRKEITFFEYVLIKSIWELTDTIDDLRPTINPYLGADYTK